METKEQAAEKYISSEEKNGLTQELVKRLFDYKDGLLYWKISNRRQRAGDVAGSIMVYKDGSERIRIAIKGVRYYASRLIFLWHKGYVPELVDHEDIDSLNNRIENLREATRSQNNANKRSIANKASKYKGVSLDKRTKKWNSEITKSQLRKRKFGFDTQEEAALDYNRNAVLLHGEFAYLNIISPLPTPPTKP